MASIFSHPAVAAGLIPWFRHYQLSRLTLVTGMILTILPDADVVAFKLGIPYGHMFGHRGFSHSIVCALILSGILAGVIGRFKHDRFIPAWIFLSISTASHGVIDAFTNGGRGIALLSPFTNHRFFAPFQPIQVSPLNVKVFFQGAGLDVILSELLWIWLPCLMVFGIGWVWIDFRSLNNRRSI